MNRADYDVVVIGGGISGLMASLHLVQQGLKTALISRGDPICCLSTGCIDVYAGTRKPLKGLKGLPKEHPYNIVGEGGIKDALEFFIDIMDKTGLPYEGTTKKNRQILTPVGTYKTTCLVPGTMSHASPENDEYIHVISFKGIKDFYPSYITSKLKNTGYSVFDAHAVSTMAIASKFEEEAFLQEFISWLQDLFIPHGRVAIPAVLGISNPLDVIEKIKAAIDREVFEIPTLPPSIPGIRLYKTLKSTLLKKGGHLYWGRPISSVESQGGQVEAVTIQTSGRPTRVHGRSFILATGSFVSGGIYATRDSVKEMVFDLPVYVPGPRDDWFNPDFFDTGHAIETAGILTDQSFKAIESDYDNLFVCGSILAYCQIMKNHCGHGLAISTGVAAAEKCEEYLS